MHFIIATSHYKWNGSSWVSVGTLPFTCQSAQNQSIFIYENYIINYSGSAFYIFDGDSWKKGEWNLYRSATYASIEYFNGNVCMIGGQHGSNGSSLFSKLLSPSIQGYMIAGTKIYSNYLFKDTENSKFISDDCIEVTNNGFTIIEFSKQDAPFVIV